MKMEKCYLGIGSKKRWKGNNSFRGKNLNIFVL